METGILITPQKDLSASLAVYQRFMADFNPDCVWIPDRFLFQDSSRLREHLGYSGKEEPREFLDPFVTIAAMAQHNPSGRFGIAVTDFIRRGAPDLARAASTLTQLLGSPLNLGFGSGEAINLTPLGYEHGDKPVSVFEERLRQFKGIRDTGLYSAPGRKPVALGYDAFRANIWMGGQRERMLGIAARYADGWLPAWHMSAAEYREKLDIVARVAAEHGRPAPKAGLLSLVVVGESKQSLYETFSSNPLSKAIALEFSAEVWRRWGLEHPFGSGAKGMPDVIIDDIDPELIVKSLDAIPPDFCASLGFFGSVREILDDLRPYRDAGLEHLGFMFIVNVNMADAFFDAGHYNDYRALFEAIKRW